MSATILPTRRSFPAAIAILWAVFYVSHRLTTHHLVGVVFAEQERGMD
jgi:hypothetical protein